jgi:hypothetical protein
MGRTESRRLRLKVMVMTAALLLLACATPAATQGDGKKEGKSLTNTTVIHRKIDKWEAVEEVKLVYRRGQ